MSPNEVSFPRYFQIVLTPIEVAIEDMQKKTAELEVSVVISVTFTLWKSFLPLFFEKLFSSF